MNNQFFNQMFNPQYVNPDYYHILQQQQYECRQQEEVAKVVKAFDDMIKASKNWMCSISRSLFKPASHCLPLNKIGNKSDITNDNIVNKVLKVIKSF